MRAKLSLFVLALVCAAAAHAQSEAGFGAVAGIIRDNLDDGLPDTTIVVSNDTLGVKRTVRTTDDGEFSILTLPPATGYNIRATRAGFVAWEYKNFAVALGATLSFVATMHPQNEPAEAPNPAVFTASVDDSRYDLSTVLSARQMEQLPDRARRLEDQILLAPLVNQDPNTGLLIFRGQRGSNEFLTDGLDTTNTYFFESPRIAPQLTPDSVEQMQVISANAPPQYIHSFGGTVNTATRRGGQEYHGSAYGFFSDHAWDAADRYGQFYPAQQWAQGGARLGGPLRSNNLFFFANLEAWHGRSQGLNELSSPVLAGAQGNSLATNCAATPTQCAAAIKFLTPQVNSLIARSTSNQAGLARVDYVRSTRSSFSFAANVYHDRSPNGAVNQAVAPNGELRGSNGLFSQQTEFARGEWTSQPGGTLSNNLRVGYLRDRISTSLNPALEPSTGALAIRIAGASVGSNPAFPQSVTDRRIQISDSLTWTIARHLLMIGGEASSNLDTVDQLNQGAGEYDYPSLTAFASDFSSNLNARNYTVFSQTLNHPIQRVREKIYGAHLQDDWRPIRRVNVEVGISYVKYHLPQPQFANQTYFQTSEIASPSNAIAPRVGVDYLLNDRTVIRFGAGEYLQPFPGELVRQLLVGNDVSQTNLTINPTQTGAPIFPNLISKSDLAPTQTRNVFLTTSKFRQPYAIVGTVSIERRLSRDFAGVLSYVDNRGKRLFTTRDLNLVKPTQPRTYLVYGADNSFTGTYTTPIWTAVADSTHAHVYEIDNTGLSRSRSLTVQLRKAMSYGFAAQVSYTWSHAFDDVSGPPLVSFIPASYLPAGYRDDQSNSSFDQRHRLVFNWTWQPKPLKGDSVAAKIANGWNLTGVFTAASGLPETPVVLVSGQQFSAAGKIYQMDYTNSLNGSGGWSRDPFVTPQKLRTEPAYIANARLTRDIPITERIRAMLMFEAFNALNRQYATSLNTISYTAALGMLHPVPGVGTGNASNGFPFGSNARFCQVAFRVEF
jgi:hypothetical protein